MQNAYYEDTKQLLMNVVACGRRFTICTDIWSKKSLSASYIGISACFFNTQLEVPQHIFLALNKMQHPHTGDAIAEHLRNTLTAWQIPKQHVLTIITDNGRNMMKARKLLEAEKKVNDNDTVD